MLMEKGFSPLPEEIKKKIFLEKSQKDYYGLLTKFLDQ